MSRFLFWVTVAALLAAAVHIGKVVFSPDLAVAQLLAQIRSDLGVNKFVVLSAEQSAALLTEPNPDLVYALCSFDVSRAPIQVETPEVADYWSVAVYSNRGEAMYSINDRQAGGRRLALSVRRAEKAGENAPQQDAGSGGGTIVVRTPGATGLVMVRAFARDATHRPHVAAALAGGSCRQAQD